jgi:hypothetical protein
MNKRTVEYLVAGALALYVVFLTRPAPAFVVQLLSSTVAQVAALAAVIYVGATQSLLVAVVLALALVMSMPAREHMTAGEKKKLDEKKKPGPSVAKKAPAADNKKAPAPAKKEKFDDDKTAPEEPAPGGSVIASPPSAEPTGSGSEKFSLMDSAPF